MLFFVDCTALKKNVKDNKQAENAEPCGPLLYKICQNGAFLL